MAKPMVMAKPMAHAPGSAMHAHQHRFITLYSETKEIEHAEFMKVISPWEREHLLLHV